MCPTIRNPNWTSSKPSWTVSKERNVGCWQLLLFFTQLSIWRSNFLSNGFTPTILSTSFNAFKQWELPCKIYWKNAFWGSNSNKTRDSLTSSISRLWNKHKSDPIVKLWSLGQSSLKILNKGVVPMSMNNHSNQCHWQLPQLGHHFVLHLKLKQSCFRMVHLIMNYT